MLFFLMYNSFMFWQYARSLRVLIWLWDRDTVSRFFIYLTRTILSISFPHILMFYIYDRSPFLILCFCSIISRVRGFRPGYAGEGDKDLILLVFVEWDWFYYWWDWDWKWWAVEPLVPVWFEWEWCPRAELTVRYLPVDTTWTYCLLICCFLT